MLAAVVSQALPESAVTCCQVLKKKFIVSNLIRPTAYASLVEVLEA